MCNPPSFISLRTMALASIGAEVVEDSSSQKSSFELEMSKLQRYVHFCVQPYQPSRAPG